MSQQEQITDEVEVVKETWRKLAREQEARGKEVPVVSLGSREDFDLTTEQGQKEYELCRRSCESTSSLMRKSRARVFAMPALPWKK